MRILINNCNYDIHIYGSGKYTLYLLHGFPLNKSFWENLVKKFAKYLKIVTIDLRGMGHSECDMTDFNFSDFALDINGIINKLKLKNIILLGHSMGGYVAMEYMRIFSEDKNILGLILVSTKDLPDTKKKKEDRIYFSKEANKGNLKRLAESQLKSLILQTNRHQHKLTDSILKQNPKNISQILIALSKRSSYKNVLKALSIPTLFIVGELDSDMYDQTINMANYQKSFSLEVISNSGHMVFLDNPIEFNKKLLRFLVYNKLVCINK